VLIAAAAASPASDPAARRPIKPTARAVTNAYSRLGSRAAHAPFPKTPTAAPAAQ